MKRVLITRQTGRSAALIERLSCAGIQAQAIPLIEIVPLDNPRLKDAFRRWKRWDWLLLTSVNAVELFVKQARQADCWPPGDTLKTAVVGPACAEALRRAGAHPDLMPVEQRAQGLVDELADEARRGRRFLWPCGALARTLPVRELTRLGGEVERVNIYGTQPASDQRKRLNRALRETPPDLILLTSSSTAENLADLADDPESLRRLPCAAIGPVTARTARRLGLQVVLVPERSDQDSLTRAVIEHLR